MAIAGIAAQEPATKESNASQRFLQPNELVRTATEYKQAFKHSCPCLTFHSCLAALFPAESVMQLVWLTTAGLQEVQQRRYTG